MLHISRGTGFILTFDNGWTVSVQFGSGNYCPNQYKPEKDIVNNGMCESSSAEIAAWWGTSELDSNWWVFNPRDKEGPLHTVKGWCTSDVVADFISHISALPNKPQQEIENA
jgi:hypothetical protein